MPQDCIILPVWRGLTLTAYLPSPEESRNLTANYITVGGGWVVQADTKDVVCRLAGIPEPWDTALPQSWFDAHQGDLMLHGGWAVWHYPQGNLFGEPRFADELERLAQGTVATLLQEALVKRDGSGASCW